MKPDDLHKIGHTVFTKETEQEYISTTKRLHVDK